MTSAAHAIQDDNVLLEAALVYAARGWHVFPVWWAANGRCGCGKALCGNPGKHPIGRLVPSGRNNATTDPKTIRRWWKDYPRASVAVATGPESGIWILDVDAGKSGEERLAELETSHGPLPIAPISMTGGGGRHYIFRHPGEKVPTKEGFGGLKGLDSRGDGGYAILPPSRHVSGGEYHWSTDAHPADIPPADAPDWLLEIVRRHPRERKANPSSPGLDTAHRAEGCGRYAAAALDGETAAVTRASFGEQESTLNAAALKIGGLVGAGALDFDRAKRALVQAGLRMANEPGRPPWTIEAIEAKVVRGLNDGRATPRKLPEPSPRASYAAAGSNAGIAGELAEFDPSDTGNARRLLRRFGEDLLYGVNIGWHHWDGARWLRDDRRRTIALAQQTAALIFEECQFLTQSDQQKARASWAIKSQNSNQISGMLAMAAPHVSVLPEDLDANPWLLNVANGTLDLHTGELRPHDRQALITKLIPIPYDPHAKAPTWEAFLSGIFAEDCDLIGFVQRAYGYSLTGDTSEQVLFILHGGGSNGKTTLLEVLAAVSADYAQQTPTETFMAKERGGGIPNDVARLKGARLVSAVETENGRRLAESLVKQATGGDRMSARFLRQEYFDFRPQLKLWLATNHKPEVRGTDDAIWRRIRLIPFEVKFYRADDASRPEGAPIRDNSLKERLMAELPGILAWAVRGCIEWQRGGLREPARVIEATAEYREEQDALGQFIAECCEMHPSFAVRTADLSAAYTAWADENGEDPLTKTALGRRLRERGLKADSTGSARIWRGIDLTEATKAAMRATGGKTCQG